MSIFSKTKKEEKKENIPQAGDVLISQPKIKAPFLLKKARITEKSVIAADLGKYVFLVAQKANKPETAKEIEAVYGVKVKDVNMINAKPKSRRLGRNVGKVPGFKKAIITLEKGQKINIMPA